ncbi:hypothetical protein GYH30_034869 [Glycine max]|uniref:Uncharacterized protein n=1 Tax=Glycine max TaxID=3847 RepID=A0A0R0GGU7_SOYBN|nr:hypothetical protein GYH30_034869 [Glycine max]
MEARKYVNTTSHFLQFKGLINCSRKKTYIWYIVWFAAVWSIWKNRNFLVLTAKKGLEEMMELVMVQ